MLLLMDRCYPLRIREAAISICTWNFITLVEEEEEGIWMAGYNDDSPLPEA